MAEFVVVLGTIMAAIAAVIRYLSASPLEELYMEGVGKTALQMARILGRMVKLGGHTFAVLFLCNLIVDAVLMCTGNKNLYPGAMVILMLMALILYIVSEHKDGDVWDIIGIAKKLLLAVPLGIPVIFSLVQLNAAVWHSIAIVMQSDDSIEILVKLIIIMPFCIGFDALTVVGLDTILYYKIANIITARRARIVLQIADKSNPSIYKWLYVYELIGDNLVCGKEEDYNRNTCIELIPMTELTRDGGNRYTLLQLKKGHKEWKRKILKFKFEPTRSWVVEQEVVNNTVIRTRWKQNDDEKDRV